MAASNEVAARRWSTEKPSPVRSWAKRRSAPKNSAAFCRWARVARTRPTDQREDVAHGLFLARPPSGRRRTRAAPASRHGEAYSPAAAIDRDRK